MRRKLAFLIVQFLSLNFITSSTIPWYENLPAVAMDYKVHVDPGKEDCYFQYVNPSATFYVSFQVMFIYFFILRLNCLHLNYQCKDTSLLGFKYASH